MRMVMPQFGARIKIKMPQLVPHKEQLQSVNSSEFDITVNEAGDELILENSLPYHDMKGHKEQLKKGLGQALPAGLPKEKKKSTEPMDVMFEMMSDESFYSDFSSANMAQNASKNNVFKRVFDEIRDAIYKDSGKSRKNIGLIDVDKVNELVTQLLSTDPQFDPELQLFSRGYKRSIESMLGKLKKEKTAYNKALKEEESLTKGKLADMLDAFFRDPRSVITDLDAEL